MVKPLQFAALRGVRKAVGVHHVARSLTTLPEPGLWTKDLRVTAPIAPAPLDFSHHASHVARLNHGSFGACPAPVLTVQNSLRNEWLAEPDRFFFSSRLHEALSEAAVSVIPALCGTNTHGAALAHSQGVASTPGIIAEQVCLVENCTVAAIVVAHRWASQVKPGDVVACLDVAYAANGNILKEYLVSRGAKIVVLRTGFPAPSAEDVVSTVRGQLQGLAAAGSPPRFVLLDHVSSQPAVLLPVKEIAAACREVAGPDGVEIALDAAHAVGSCDFDVRELGVDWFFSNLHKWGFCPNTATIMYAASPQLMGATRHPITSWHWGEGLARECQFTGTRDYSAMLSAPAAMEYLAAWRSPEGETSQQFCHRRVLEAAAFLAHAWGTEAETERATVPELVATQAMVKLPPALRVDDKPGQPSQGVRATLRNEFNVEAAIGNFVQGDLGAYVRLSYAVYNTPDDIERLAHGVLSILRQQEAGKEAARV